jgi:hypothetical protein
VRRASMATVAARSAQRIQQLVRVDPAGADNGVRPVHGPFDHHDETLRLSTCPGWSYR